MPPTPQRYYVWVFYADTTRQHYYTASLKSIPSAAAKNIKVRYTVIARSEHDAIARVMMEGYETRERY